MICVRNEVPKKATLDDYVKRNLVKCRRDDERGLNVYVYTVHTQINRFWNYATLAARGIVYDDKGRLIQRCLPKFFNYNEPDGIAMAEHYKIVRPTIQEKLDGSLIKVTNDQEYGLVVTSKGSFDSEQVKMANKLLEDKRRLWQFEPGLTYHFELVSPKNKIVVPYRDTELVLFCVIKNDSGVELDLNDRRFIKFTKPLTYDVRVLDDVNSLNAHGLHEGVVANFTYYRLKFKTDEYLRLHRLVTDLTPKRVWEALSIGQEIDRLCVPEEFINWLDRTEEQLKGKYHDLSSDVAMAILYCRDMTNKEVATCPNPFIRNHKSYVLAYRSGKDVPQMMWQAIKPKGGVK
jgi:RNA ligase